MPNTPSSVPAQLAVGALHHVAIAVESVDAAVAQYEKAFGWRRMMDTAGEGSAKIAAIIGVEGVESARAVVMQAPDMTGKGAAYGMVEFLEFVCPDAESRAKLPTGLLALSYRVREIEKALQELVDQGYEKVCDPVELDFAGYNVRAATVRSPHVVGLIEIVEFLGA